jgi:hypothetical protein
MKTVYENGKGLVIFVPPTESSLAAALVELIIERVGERGGDSEQFQAVLNCIIYDRSGIQ